MTNVSKLLSPFIGFREKVDYEIAIYKSHIEKVEALLKQEIEELEENFEKSLQNVSSEDEAQYRMEQFGASEEFWLVKDELPRLQRQGDLIGVFSFLENRLNSICSRHSRFVQMHDKYHGRQTQRKELKDMGGRGLEKAVAYLKEVIQFPSESHAWREITSIQKIRNAFTHSEGFIMDFDAGKKRHIESYISKSDYLRINSEKIVILKGLSSYCLNQFKAFFSEVITLLEEAEEIGGASCGLATHKI